MKYKVDLHCLQIQCLCEWMMASTEPKDDEPAYIERSFFVSDKLAGRRVDQALQLRYPTFSRSYWRKQIDRGRIRLNGKPLRPSSKLKYGQRIVYPRFTPLEPDINVDVEFIYGDARMLVLYKRPDLPVHPAGVYYYNSLFKILEAKGCGDENWHVPIVHFIGRLDRETSGLMVIAKDKEAAVYLQRRGVVAPIYHKLYVVAVQGKYPDYKDVRGSMGPAENAVVRKMRRFADEAFAGSVPSRTEFYKLHYNRRKDQSLLLARLHTGRQHQIRASLYYTGWPVVGDRLYGEDPAQFLRFIDKKETAEEVAGRGIDRTALHCAQLSILHPSDGRHLDFYRQPPDDIRALFPDYDFGYEAWQRRIEPWLKGQK